MVLLVEHLIYFGRLSTVVMCVLNATFNNVSETLLWLVLLVEDTGVQETNHRRDASHRQTLSHKLYRIQLLRMGIKLTNYVGTVIYCLKSCKSNYITNDGLICLFIYSFIYLFIYLFACEQNLSWFVYIVFI